MRHPMLLALLLFLPLLGCANALSVHATIGTVASAAIVSTAPLVPAACDHELATCAVGDVACVERIGAGCRDAASAFEATALATRAYVDAVRLASLASDGDVLPVLLPAARSLKVSWDGLVLILGRHGITLPTLDVAALLGGGS